MGMRRPTKRVRGKRAERTVEVYVTSNRSEIELWQDGLSKVGSAEDGDLILMDSQQARDLATALLEILGHG
jgi:hypothetical protein